jgi:quercetin dioxygenase-like cupin family protein
MRRRHISVGFAAAVVMATVVIGAAQQAAFKRTEVQRIDLSAPGREAVMVVADIPTGATSGRHTHPGEEVAYVLEGAIVLDVAGKTPVTLKAGQGFVIPAGVPHSATNKAPAPARVLANYIIEKGKAIATPAP